MRTTHEKIRSRPGSINHEGFRTFVHPAEVQGKYRSRRTQFELLLSVIFFALPILKVNGMPAIFLDVAKREFTFFGLRFWATDVPLIFPLVAGFFVALMLVSAIWGRVWCGWACPQTVAIDFAYRRIEGWIEGSPQTRRLLDASPWGGEKILRRGAKVIAFAAVSIFLAHAFLAYFVSWAGWREKYAGGFSGSTATLVMLILLSIIFFLDFGWFREQFCLVACPYGRWQTVWSDENSMVVDYAGWRGEPRRGAAPVGGAQGDCVNCYHCVQSCPTGVDIRFGVQPECIACTACMDACDVVMKQMNKKQGLIRYTSAAQLRDSDQREMPFRAKWQWRSYLYICVLAILFSGFIIALIRRGPLWVYLKRAPGLPYVSSTKPDGGMEVVNVLNASVRNLLAREARVAVSINEIAYVNIEQGGQDIVLAPGEQRSVMLLIKYAPPAGTPSLSRPRDLTLQFSLSAVGESEKWIVSEEFRFMGP